MKLWSIALFMFVIQVSAALIDNSNAFDSTIAVDTSGIQSANQSVRSRYYNTTGEDTQNDYEEQSGSDFLGLAGRIFNVAKTLMDFGIPIELAITFSLPIYLLWIVAIIQFFWRKDFTGMI